MRHLWSLLAGLVAAPLAWLFLATGQFRSSQTVADWRAESFFDTADLIAPAAFVAAAGILLGLLGTLRLSPAGPLVAGLLLVTPTVLMFINPFETLDGFDRPRRLFEQDLQPWLPVENGTLLVLGALLLMAVFSAKRWRRWPAAPAPLAAVAVAGGLAGEGGRATAVSEPMSDEEILAAAAEMEEADRATAGRAEGSAEPEPAPATASEQPTETAPVTETEPEAKTAPEAGTDPEHPSEHASERAGSESSSSRSGASSTG